MHQYSTKDFSLINSHETRPEKMGYYVTASSLKQAKALRANPSEIKKQDFHYWCINDWCLGKPFDFTKPILLGEITRASKQNFYWFGLIAPYPTKIAYERERDLEARLKKMRNNRNRW